MSGLGTTGGKLVESREADGDINGSRQVHRVVVCADVAASAANILPHARAIAAALSTELMLVHVMEPQTSQYLPVDPVQWDVCRCEAEAFVSKIVKEHELDEHSIYTRIMQGRTSEQISACLTDDLDDVVALCRSRVQIPGYIGQTARHVLEDAGSSALIIPPGSGHAREVHYRRLLVPLDGSSRGEAAIPVAKKIARAQGAEIILVHAVPDPFLIQSGPLHPEDIELRDSLLHRNERVARDYLQRQCEQINRCGLAARPVVLVDGDVRRQLNGVILTESADLVVLSSHGNSGHADASIGDIAGFLLANAAVPVLMMRQAHNTGSSHVCVSNQSTGVRLPTGTV